MDDDDASKVATSQKVDEKRVDTANQNPNHDEKTSGTDAEETSTSEIEEQKDEEEILSY